MNEDVKEMLMNLKKLEQDNDINSQLLSNPDCSFRLSDTVSQGKNWRMIAQEAYDQGYIRYPNKQTYSHVARITPKGIDALNSELAKDKQ